jgi:hypothetical protein
MPYPTKGKNIRRTILAVVCGSLLWVNSVALALEFDWPEIVPGVKLEETSNMAKFALYFTSLFVVIGTFIMFVAVMSAGFKLITSMGNPGTFQEAKNKLLGAVVGLVILLGAYPIIGAINDRIPNPESPETDCVGGVRRDVLATTTDEKTGKEREKFDTQCFQGDTVDTALKEGQEVVGEEKGTFSKCYLRELITYSEKDYKGEKSTVFKDDTVTNENCPEDVNEKTKVGGANSLRLINKKDGLYLYDNFVVSADGEGKGDTSRETYRMSPYFINDNTSNLNDLKINDKIDSIEFVFSKKRLEEEAMEDPTNKSFGYYNGAVVFSEPNYRGNCLAVSDTYIDMKREDKATGKEIDLRDNISSVLYYTSPLTNFVDRDMGAIVLYAVPNCQDVSTNNNTPEKNKYDKCYYPISPGIKGYHDLEELINGGAYCSKETFLTDKSEERLKKDPTITDLEYYPIQSMKIEGSAGVVLKSESGNCRYFNLKDSDRRGNCITNLQDVFQIFKGSDKPKTIMVIPLEQKQD